MMAQSTAMNQDDLGDYYGKGWSADEYDGVFLYSGMLHKHLEDESALMRRKWFDYRTMHPVEATYYFAECYTKAYQRFIAERFDYERAPFMKPFKGKDIFKQKRTSLTGFWKARRKADELGMPYEVFIFSIMQWASDRLWKRAPRPIHMYSDDAVAAAKTYWTKECRHGMPEPRLRMFRSAEFCGNVIQMAYQTWVCDLIRKRPNLAMSLASYLYLTPIVVPKVAVQKFPREVVEAAMRESKKFA